METNPQRLVQEVCEHHRVDPGELTSLFVGLLMAEAAELARCEEGGSQAGDASDAETIAMLETLTEQFRGYVAGIVCGAEQAVESATRKLMEAKAGSVVAADLLERRDGACHAVRVARAMAAVVNNALTAGRHFGFQAAVTRCQ